MSKRLKRMTAFYFKEQPADRPIGKNQKQDMIKQTTEPWECHWRWDGVYKKLWVPKGYVYDGASVPRPVWTIVGLRPDGLIRAASLGHDAPFRAEGGLKDWGGCTLTGIEGDAMFMCYDEANDLFYYAMRFAKMYRHRARIGYTAVQTFGRKHWGGPMPSLNKKSG